MQIGGYSLAEIGHTFPYQTPQGCDHLLDRAGIVADELRDIDRTGFFCHGRLPEEWMKGARDVQHPNREF
jgi:hypothetical protein